MLDRQTYAGRSIALLTQHGKQQVLREAFTDPLGARLVHTDAYDTDQLGSFTREIPRLDSALITARRKAELAMQLTGLSCAIASEGSFGAGPVACLPWDEELVLLVDREHGFELVGRAAGPANVFSAASADWDEVSRWATRAGFPQQQLVVRSGGTAGPCIEKGIADWAALEAAFQRALRAGEGQPCGIECDLRAFASPARMARIGDAARDLLARLGSACPACGMAGFAAVTRVAGLSCEACGSATSLARAEIWRCLRCPHSEQRDLGRSLASPAHCDVCNP